MSILRDFERRLEGAVEGFFARAFRSGLQPVELAKAIQRYEGDFQQVGVSGRVRVPNVFRFTLSPRDLERFSGFTRSLQRELAEVARRTADEKGWTTEGPIRIEFERSDDIRVGTFELRGKAEAPTRPAARQAPAAQPSAPQPSAQQPSAPQGGAPQAAQPMSQSERPVRSKQPDITPAPATSIPATAALRAVGGSDTGKSFTLDKPQLVIGRLPECDITLTGSAVSRRHARVQREGARWTITDLGSTNGVRVNAQPVQVAEIRSGDRVEVGDITFTFVTG